MPTVEQMVQQIENEKNMLKQIKNQSSSLSKRQEALRSMPHVASGGDLKKNMMKYIPSHLLPSNVGNINSVSWPFWYSVDFDLGTTPQITANLNEEASFQVSEEAAFIMYALSREIQDYDEGGELGPLQLEFRDRQSSRYFNNAPVPIQMIGQRSYPTVLPVPMLLMPNAKFEVALTSWLTGTQNQQGAGNGKIQVTFEGIRIRVADAGKVLSSIFG